MPAPARQNKLMFAELIRSRNLIQGAVLTGCVHVFIVAFYFRAILLGDSTFIKDGDSADQTFCWLIKVFHAIKQGKIVLWDFGTLSGTSFIGELQTGPLYPPALLFGLFVRDVDATSVDYFLLLHFLVAALGMHALARAFRLPWIAGLGGAIVYAYASVFAWRVGGQGNLFAGLAWLPWAAAAAQWAATATSIPQSASRACGVGICIALAFLAGHNHSPVYAGIAVCAVAAGPVITNLVRLNRVELFRSSRYCIITIVAACVAALVICAPQLIATEEYLRQSYKWFGEGYTSYPHIVPYEEYLKWGLHDKDILTVITGGVISGEGGTLFFTWTGALCATVGLALASFGRSRALASLVSSGVLIVVLSLAMGYVTIPPFGWLFYHMPIINTLRTPSRAICLFAFGASLLAMGGMAALFDELRVLFSRWRLGTAIYPQLILAVMVIIVMREAKALNHGVMTDAPNRQVQQILDGNIARTLLDVNREQPLIYRYYGSREFVPPNLPNVYPLLSAEGYRSSREIGYYKYFDYDPKSEHTKRLGIRWWITDRELTDLRLINSFGKVHVYERADVLPVFSLQLADGRHVAAPIEIIEWGVNEVTLRFFGSISGKLVFAQAWYPGWTAYSDGSPSVVQADEALMSVRLPEQTHVVTFSYSPAWFWRSLALSLGGLVVMISFGVYRGFGATRRCQCPGTPMVRGAGRVCISR
jgi:hypothetical protein